MNSNTPTEVQVITEMDVYAASVRKVVSSGNLNASPLEEASYSWSDVEESFNKEKPKVEKPIAEKPSAQEQPKVEEKPNLTESEINTHLDGLITGIVHKENNVKVDVELKSDKDMYELGDSESDMPELVSDTDSEMPDLVEESDDDTSNLVEESESETEELMIAVFKRPSCPRCEAALKILMSHDENSELEVSEQEHTSDSDESVSSDSTDDSDSDYVPSDMESGAESESESESEFESPRMARKREVVIPPLIKFIIILLVVVRILKFLSNYSPNRIQYYA